MEQILRNILQKYYYNINEPTSYSHKNLVFKHLLENYPDPGGDLIENWFQRQLPYLVYKPLKKKFFKNPIVSKRIDHIWNADLVENLKYHDNDGIRYLLVVIDNLSKFAWIRMLENKRGETVTNAFRDILETSGRQPEILGCDYGNEFTNHAFRDMLEEYGIANYLMYAPDKATIVERLNQTLKMRLYRYMYYNETFRFVTVLNNVLNNYNHSIHSTTKFRPDQVNEFNQRRVFRNLYKYKYREQEQQKFFEGDHVLIPDYINRDPTKMRMRFRRTKYKREIYTIAKVLYRSPRFKYVVQDPNRNVIRNTFYDNQLVKTLL